MIDVIFNGKLIPHLVVVIAFFFKSLKDLIQSIFELDDEQDGIKKQVTCNIQRII